MKNFVMLFLFVIFMSSFFTGCYTVVWDPREEFPNTENSYETSDDFYTDDYYGGYVEYYESPWWVSIPVYVTYPGGTTDSQTKERNNGRDSETETIRNSNGRGNTDRNSGIDNTTPPPTTTTTTSSGNSSNSNIINTPPPTRDTNTSNTNSTSSSTSNTRNSGSSETRNSSGSRNSGSGRR
ncbi:MAG TPA: hypothetical protein DHV28_01540 [Ignavibacteriales bacterium]|nr:hypothetical protein [Ignavibacteriales bacterium]